MAMRVASVTNASELSGDSFSRYHQIAINLLQGNGFSRSTSVPFLPASLDQPGYPLFVALFYRLFGNDQLPIYIAQVLLELGIILVLVLIARGIEASQSCREAGRCLEPDLPDSADLWRKTNGRDTMHVLYYACLSVFDTGR